MQQFVQHISPIRSLAARDKMFNHLPQNLGRVNVGQHRRITGHQHRVTAERFDFDSHLSQQVAGVKNRGGLGRGQMDRFGHQQSLSLHRTCKHFFPQLFVQNALV